MIFDTLAEESVKNSKMQEKMTINVIVFDQGKMLILFLRMTPQKTKKQAEVLVLCASAGKLETSTLTSTLRSKT